MPHLGRGDDPRGGRLLLFGRGDRKPAVFASRPEPELREAGTDRVLHVRGRLRGFISCGNWGSRPRIRVDTAWATDRRVGDLYP